MTTYKVIMDSPLEILTSESPTIVWELRYDDFLDKITKELLGVNHAKWKTPRRGFYANDALYWINIPQKKLYEQEKTNILIREFDKIPFSGRYATNDKPEAVLDSFLKAGYSIEKDEGYNVRSG